MKIEAIHIIKTLNEFKNKGFITLLSLIAEELSTMADDANSEKKFLLTYTLYNPVLREFKQIETVVNAEIHSVCTLFKSANYDEREIYDLFGVKFKNHPNLDRIFLDKNFSRHPLAADVEIVETQAGEEF